MENSLNTKKNNLAVLEAALKNKGIPKNYYSLGVERIEPDGSERFRIIPPIVSEWSNPEKAHFYYVQFLKSGECECVFDDGHDEYRSRLSLVNGEVSYLRKTRV